MPFKKSDVSHLLVSCHRRCCICHRFCGVKIETDHIVPKEEGGTDDIDNAIPVCFECHAEIHSYNDKHPRGRKYTSEELKAHKDQWLKICQDKTEILLQAFVSSDVGPLQALIDELEFNSRIAELDHPNRVGCHFRDEQFSKAIQRGSIAILRNELKDSINEAYVTMGSANALISAAHYQQHALRAEWINKALEKIREVKPQIGMAKEGLLKFLGQE